MASLPTHTEGYGVQQQNGRLVLMEVELIPPTATTVDIKMSHCSLCMSDVHMVGNDWRCSTYPMVPGHEGTGVVTAVGEKVKNIAVGDVVGVGWIRDSCRTCENCMCGEENVCLGGNTPTFLNKMSTQGCFNKIVRIEERFAFKLPEGMDPASAGPLLCAGATVYTPLRDYAKVNSHVGILGLGGLGHLAVKLAVAMGCHVTVLSSKEEKRDRAMSLGAHNYITYTDPEQLFGSMPQLNLIIDTAPSTNIPLDEFIEMLLLPKGVYCKVGLPPVTPAGEEPRLSCNLMSLVGAQKRLVGSSGCGTSHMAELLQLCHVNGILPQVTEMDFTKVNEAFDLLKHGSIPDAFRIVLKW